MHTLLQVLIGLTLVFVSAVGEVEAQAFLGGDPRRADDVVEQQIDALRARARCVEQHTTARTQVWSGHAGQFLSPEARAAREVQLADADHQFRDCLAQSEALILRQTCLTAARTEAQRSRCYQ